jgi:hypothetical protein
MENREDSIGEALTKSIITSNSKELSQWPKEISEVQ